MSYTITVVEQLHRAKNEIISGHPIDSRLAIILIDNSVEIILGTRCEARLNMDHHAGKIPAEQRRLVRSRWFESKLRFLRELGEIDENEFNFLVAAHDLRNELFHVGMRRDNALRSVALEYFKVACKFFGAMAPSIRSLLREDNYTPATEHYFRNDEGSISILDTEYADLSGHLLKDFPGDIEPLQKVLGIEMESRLNDLEYSFEFLINDNPARYSSEEILKISQIEYDVSSKIREKGIAGSWMKPGYSEAVHAVRSEVELRWRQKHRDLPIKKWLKRAEKIESESNSLISLHLYRVLHREILYIEEAISEAALELDIWIQMEIDRARGK